MRASPAQIQRLAGRIVDAIVAQGYVEPRKEVPEIRERIAALIIKTFEDEEALEDEAERIATRNARQMSGIDQSKMIQMIKRKLAEDKGFPL